MGMFDTKTVWRGLWPKTLYKIKYPAVEKRRFLGITYHKKVTKTMWVDWKTYSKYKYKSHIVFH